MSLAEVSGCFTRLSFLFSGKVKGNSEGSYNHCFIYTKAPNSLKPVVLFLFFQLTWVEKKTNLQRFQAAQASEHASLQSS